MPPEVKLAMITSRNDTLVLFRGVWHPIEKIPAEYHDLAHSIAKPWFEFSGKSASHFQASNEEPKREALNKIEEIPKKVYTQCPTLPVSAFPAIDPIGTPVLQQCMGCGYQAVESYPATCPTCRNPYPVSLVISVPWPELLRLARRQQPLKTEDLTPQKQVVLKLKPGQLNLFGGVA